MTQSLPERPNLEQLKKQAKTLLAEARAQQPGALARFDDLGGRPPALHDAQRSLAREYGFPSWNQLRVHVEALSRATGPFEDLAAAIRADNEPLVRSLLAGQPALAAIINEPLPGEGFGETALIVAARRGHQGVVEALVNAGASVAVRSRWWAGSFSALDQAKPELVPWLLARGAPVDAVTAARLGLLDILKKLVAADPAAVHARGGDGQTPLHVAATVPIARFLVENGASLDVRDVDHESTPVQYALRDRLEVARFLVEQGCQTDLLIAAAIGDHTLVRHHLDRDPSCIRLDVSMASFPKMNPEAGGTIYIWTLGWYQTAHDLARRNGDQALVAFLLQASPPSLRLAKACEWGDQALLRTVTSAGPVPVDPRDEPKIVAAAHGNSVRGVSLMLGFGWSATAEMNGATALHWSAWHGNAQLVQTLLAAEAPVSPKDGTHQTTPLNWALHGSRHSWERKSGDYGRVVSLLLEAGAAPPDADADLDASDEAIDAIRRAAR